MNPYFTKRIWEYLESLDQFKPPHVIKCFFHRRILYNILNLLNDFFYNFVIIFLLNLWRREKWTNNHRLKALNLYYVTFHLYHMLSVKYCISILIFMHMPKRCVIFPSLTDIFFECLNCCVYFSLCEFTKM